jgi:hypothetical protein
MAMGNTYGVLLITVLLGSGLVGVPKRLWMMADDAGELMRMYISVSYRCIKVCTKYNCYFFAGCTN